jgi:hypothetical protein
MNRTTLSKKKRIDALFCPKKKHVAMSSFIDDFDEFDNGLSQHQDDFEYPANDDDVNPFDNDDYLNDDDNNNDQQQQPPIDDAIDVDVVDENNVDDEEEESEQQPANSYICYPADVPA